MEFYRRLVTEILPDRLQRVPVPDSFFGIFKLSLSEMASLALFTGASSFLAYSVYTTCRLKIDQYRAGNAAAGSGKVGKGTLVNISLRKDVPKVADTINCDEIGEKVAMCRCWRSKKFPYCDGSHNQHNTATGDNVGPLIVKK